MAFDSKGLDDYVDVNQRIADFREQYPNGSLQPADPAHPWEQAVVNGFAKNGEPFAATMIVYTAAAYRTPDDPRPGIGVAWEPFPGRTPYTLGSELMNAETSAWGRAIVAALASDSKRGVASREEVRNRVAERDGEPQDQPPQDPPPPALRQPKPATPAAQNGRTRTRIPGPDHERLRDGTARGRVEGTQRGPVPPGEDPWAGQPAGEPVTHGLPPDERPGSMDDSQRRAIFALLTRLDITDANAQRAEMSRLTGRDVDSRKSLTWREAEDVKRKLGSRAQAAAEATP